MKKLFITIIIVITGITFITIIPHASFAIPGQLIYDTNVPDVTNSCEEAIAPYKNESERNSALYKACQLQKSQLEKDNLSLMKSLSQEKKNVKNTMIIFIIVIVAILLSALAGWKSIRRTTT